MTRKFLILFCMFLTRSVYALEPEQILIIANEDINESVRLAEYYCSKRTVPAENILRIPLGPAVADQISRQKYDKVLVPAVKKVLSRDGQPDRIKCLLTVYGVPIKVGPAGPVGNADELVPKLSGILSAKEEKLVEACRRLNELGRAELARTQNSAQPESYEDVLKHLTDDAKQAIQRIEYIEREDVRKTQYDSWIKLIRFIYGPAYARQQAEQLPQISFELSGAEREELREIGPALQTAQRQNWPVEKKLDKNFYSGSEFVGGFVGVIADIKADIGRCKGAETNASVDSELSMVLSDEYDLYRWQENEMQDKPVWLPTKTLMVSRLDGPSAEIASGLIDKAIEAEQKGLCGTVYIDARGLDTVRQPSPNSFEFFDESLHSLAAVFKKRTTMNVDVENTESLFAPGACPNTAIYCGWYSLKKYIDAFDFVPGAVGFHIASLEAADLHNPAGSNWCTAMLCDGITATLGAVNEPYLHSFPRPDKFFGELLDGKSLVEAFYRTKPFNSWQMVLIGDPLYKLNIK